MMTRTLTTVLVLALVSVLTGCDSDRAPGPTAPPSIQPPTPQPPAPQPPLPRSYTISGVISAQETALSEGPTPLAGASVEVESCYQSNGSAVSLLLLTDATGAYRTPVCAGPMLLWAYKAGYQHKVKQQVPCPHHGDCFQLSISDDTRFDVELVKQ
jgi:hypothetical protein